MRPYLMLIGGICAFIVLIIWANQNSTALDFNRTIRLTNDNDTYWGSANSFGIDGNNIYVTDQHNKNPMTVEPPMKTYLRKSLDGGKTYTSPSIINNYPPSFNEDWEIIDTDVNGTIYFKGELFGTGLEGLYFAVSKDRGTSFQITSIFQGSVSNFLDVHVTISKSGTIYFSWGEPMGNYSCIWLAKSFDNGISFSAPQKIIEAPLLSEFNMFVDDNERVFIVWTSWTGDVNSTLLYNLYISFSLDSGNHFNKVVQINKQPSLIILMSSNSIVGTNDGKIMILWEEFNNDDKFFHLTTTFISGNTIIDKLINFPAINNFTHFTSTLLIDKNNILYLLGPWGMLDGANNSYPHSWPCSEIVNGIFFSYSSDFGIAFTNWTYVSSPVLGIPEDVTGFIKNGLLYVGWHVNQNPTIAPDEGNWSHFLIKFKPLNQPPIPRIDSPKDFTRFNKSDEIFFDASSTFDVDRDKLSYYWTSNLSGFIGMSTRFIKQIHPGNYYITMWVDDGFGYNVSASVNISVVNRAPVALISSPSENATFYSFDDILFDGTQSFDPDGDPISFCWTVDGQPRNLNESFFTLKLAKGRHGIGLRVVDVLGEYSTTTVNITVINHAPFAAIMMNSNYVYTSEMIILNCSGSYDPDGLIESYDMEFGDGTNATGTMPLFNHSYPKDGRYTVNLTVIDNDGLSSITSIEIVVMNRPPHANISHGQKAWFGRPISFDGAGSSDEDGRITSYYWDFADGTNASGAVAKHKFTQSWSFTVTLTVTDDDGGVGTATISVFVDFKEETSLPWYYSPPLWVIVVMFGCAMALFWNGLRTGKAPPLEEE